MCGVSSDGPVELDARVANNRVVDPYPDAKKALDKEWGKLMNKPV